MIKRLLIVAVFILLFSQANSQDIELVNNFLMNLSFVTGTDRGMEKNLDDNFSWMQNQGYTHLRFFGIFPNGVHCFPSATLDSNGYPNSSYHEPVLALLAAKASQYDIVINFDGWEVIAESNHDTTILGVNLVTPDELGQIVQDVLDFGVTLISEEQFGNEFLQTIQATTLVNGATHETTAGLWYQSSNASMIADAQLVSVFNFFPRDQSEADSIIVSGHGYDIPATLGISHLFLESPRYFSVPTSLAVGSFGTLQTENWRNVLRFTQIQHYPDRLSIEEQNNSFLISSSFNFSEYIGNELILLRDDTIAERPIMNLVLDAGTLFSGSYLPTWHALLVNGPAIVGTFTPLGYRVVATIDSLLPDAEIYYVLLAGGTDALNVAPLPNYVSNLLAGSKPVFIQPTYGIPDDNDATDWLPLREHFGLATGETETIFSEIPETVIFNGNTTKWGGIELYLTPCIELLPSSIDTTIATIALSGNVSGQETPIIISNGDSWLINSGVIHLEASYVLSYLLDGPLNKPAGANIVFTDNKGLIFAEYSTGIDINLPWSGTTKIIRYDPIGDLVSNIELDLHGSFSTSMERGDMLIFKNLSVTCCENRTGNVDNDANDQTDIADITALIDFLFISETPPICMEEANTDGLGVVDIGDLTKLIDFLFISGTQTEPCQ